MKKRTQKEKLRLLKETEETWKRLEEKRLKECGPIIYNHYIKGDKYWVLHGIREKKGRDTTGDCEICKCFPCDHTAKLMGWNEWVF